MLQRQTNRLGRSCLSIEQAALVCVDLFILMGLGAAGVPSGMCTSVQGPFTQAPSMVQGFYDLTGYSAAEVLSRNCRFMQGPGTSRAKVAEMRDAIREERACEVGPCRCRSNDSIMLQSQPRCGSLTTCALPQRRACTCWPAASVQAIPSCHQHSVHSPAGFRRASQPC